MSSLGGQVALVTGGSRGLGAAIARALGEAGATVVVNYLQQEAAAALVVRDIEASGGKAVLLRGDVRDLEALDAAWRRLASDTGVRPPTILVHSAGARLQPAGFLDVSWETFEHHFGVAIRGAFNACRLCLPAMVEQRRGSIIFVASAAAHAMPPPQWSAYVTAKSALLGLMRSLAVEFGPQGIRVNAVSPSMMPTDLTSFVPDRAKQMIALQTPLRRLAKVEDVAHVVAFLASDAASFVTGATVPVAGGSPMV